MPKRNQAVPPPAYGSPEWKAERARMVGTPEWKAANNYQAPTSKTNDPMARGVYFEAALPFTPHGTTLTTAEKQAQSPLYNPLYDPGSAEYKANLAQISNPKPRIQMPASNLSQSFQNQNQIIPSYTPPAAGPNAAANPVSYPQVTLPETYRQPNNSTGATAPTGGTFGIKMPDLNGPLGQFKSGGNWNDLLSIAHNRYQR